MIEANEKAKRLKAEAQRELEEHIIPFWLGLMDKENGGFYGEMSYSLEIDKKADKGGILHSRILWFLSNAYRLLRKEELKAAADHAFSFIQGAFFDKTHGGVFWSVDFRGTPADTTKHTYCQAFALYALSAYFGATGNVEAKELAESLFELIEERSRDEISYKEAFKCDFSPAENDKLSENGVNATYTMNTLLHIFEAYTEYFAQTRDIRAQNAMKSILNIFVSRIWNAEKGRQEVFFDENMRSLIDLYSYGHDIESSWLIDKGLFAINDGDLKEKAAKITLEMAENVRKYAISPLGAVYMEAENGVQNTSCVWWEQAEGVLGFFNAWQKTKEEKFLDSALNAWEFIKKYIIDERKGGEWHWQTDKNGAPDAEKTAVSAWKCPYHNGRMCFELMERI